MLRIVLDTNVLVASISQKSPFHWAWRAFLQGKYQLCVTTDILNEYEEIVERYFSAVDAGYTLKEIMLHDNTIQIIRYFEWNILTHDPDDNKFFDCAVAASADFIVSEDKHFNILKNIPFPSVKVLTAAGFKQVIDNL